MPLAIGQTLHNRYRIVKLIGQGGFGAVYRAWDTALNQPCAVKENLDTSAEAQRQFYREATLLAGLRHLNLPRVTDHFLIPGQGQYLVMDFVEGQSLENLVASRSQPLTEAETLAWLQQVGEALAYLHSQNPPVIHRDIKPANIILTPQGQAMLVDFGISKVYDPVLRTTTGGRAVTPGFSPPEQYGGSADRTDARSDIYALGATLFATLTGTPPPDAIDRVTHGAALPSLASLRPDLSSGLLRLVDDSLLLSHTQRPASVSDQRKLLSGNTVVPPTSPSPPTQSAAPAPVPRRISGALAAFGIGAIVVIISVAFLLARNSGGAAGTPTTTARSLAASVTIAPAAVLPAATSVTRTAIFPATATSASAATLPDETATSVTTATRTPTATPPRVTATRSPTSTSTKTKVPPTATATPTKLSPTTTSVPGAPTPTIDPDAFTAVSLVTRPSSKTGLSVAIRYADSIPKRGSWVGIYRQTTDVSGNLIKGERIADGRTDDSGAVFFALPPDNYAVQLGDYAGYPWGDEYNYQVNAGKETAISVTLGKLLVGVMDPDGRGVAGRWTGMYTQKTDVGGNPIQADRIADGRTADTGSITYDLSPGLYAVGIGDIAGYLWGEELNHPVLPGQTTQVLVQLGRLSVGVRNAEGKGLGGKWVGLYLQKQDLNGNPIKADRILDGRTNSAGSLAWNVTAGSYAVGIGDIAGELWGEELNYEIKPGQATPILLTLGRLSVGLQDVDGRPINNRWVGVYYQKKDVSGNIVKGDRFLDGRTDSTGLIRWDITAGHYVVEFENIGTLLDVVVQPGFDTTTDGVSAALQEVLVDATGGVTAASGIPSALDVGQQASDKSGIRVNILLGDGVPKRGSWVGIFRQIEDISGNPIKGERVADGRTDDAGTVFFPLPSGVYAVQLGDYVGNSWGDEYGYAVKVSKATVLEVTMGKLQIGVLDAAGKAVSGRWTGIYRQENDISGNPITTDRIADGRTADTGSMTYDLMPGVYGVEIGDIVGNEWGEPLNHVVEPGQTTNILVQLGRLSVGVRDADGKGLGGKWVGVYQQKADLNGNPIFGNRILDGRTDNTGLISWDMTAGKYAVSIGDVAGEPWGEELNHEIVAGKTTPILLTLGRLAVALKDADGKPLNNRRVSVYFQMRDARGRPTGKGDRFLDGRTDITGALTWDITAGHYVVEIEGFDALSDVTITSGRVTATDGKAATVK